jgi:hypothetical protein
VSIATKRLTISATRSESERAGEIRRQNRQLGPQPGGKRPHREETTPRRRRRFAYGFARQLLTLEASSLFRVELPCGDDADRRVIVHLDMDDEEESSNEGVA